MGRFAWTIVAVAALVRAAAPAPQEPSTFKVGTRLVQVDVVVRDKNGPVTGLTREDFALFDCKSQPTPQQTMSGNFSWCRDKRQAIQVFQAPDAVNAKPLATRTALPSGSVSNRVDSQGEAVGSATVVLLDQLNTSFDHKEYQRLQLIKYLKSVKDADRIAVYSLGHGLHILQDFTDDPKKLVDAVSKLDSGLDAISPIPGDPTIDLSAPPTKTGDDVTDAFIAKMIAGADAVNPAIRVMFAQMTEQAIQKIVQHMSGVPGRKNLVWIKEEPQIPPKARLMLQEANIALYPVLVRALQPSGVMAMSSTKRFSPPPPMEFALRHAVEDLGASTGGTGFTDAGYIGNAVSRAEEDSGSAYVLGFYPSENDLNGKLHTLNVALSGRLAKSGMQLSFRTQYVATAQPSLNGNGSLTDIFDSPLNATAIGLTGEAIPDPSRPGAYELEITVSLADVQLRQMGDRWVGSLQTAVRRDLPDASGVIRPSQPFVQVEPINLSQEQFQARASSGVIVRQRWTGLGTAGGSLRIVIQDQATGAAGSLRVPLGKA
jgi:VWFA-related protein